MNRIRYWKKKYNLLCSIYDNEGKDLKDSFLRRIYHLIGDLEDYIFLLEDDSNGK